jgi:hypothetical protein
MSTACVMSRILTTNVPSTEVGSSLECAGELGKRSTGQTDFVATSPNIAILSQDISRHERSHKAVLVACLRESKMTDGIFITCGPILPPRRSLNKGVLKEYLDYSNSAYVVTKAYSTTKCTSHTGYSTSAWLLMFQGEQQLTHRIRLGRMDAYNNFSLI